MGRAPRIIVSISALFAALVLVAGVARSVGSPRRLKNINPTGDSITGLAVNAGGTLFFAADDGTTGYELWKSDGTSAGTVLVEDIYPGPTGSNPSALINVGGTLFFSANDGTAGTELWSSDGTPGGTDIVEDIQLGPSGSSASRLTNVGGAPLLRGRRRDDGIRAVAERRNGARNTHRRGHQPDRRFLPRFPAEHRRHPVLRSRRRHHRR